MRHILVYQESGKFLNAPANVGIWAWGDEILVGFFKGTRDRSAEKPQKMDRSKPLLSPLARSLDGGQTWAYQDTPPLFNVLFGGSGLPGEDLEVASLPEEGVNFAHPDFAMRAGGSYFCVSYDRGLTWKGAYSFPDLGLTRLTSRTSYVVLGPEKCLFFLSCRDPSLNVECKLADRTFCARTTDGGRSFEFLGWMVPEDPAPRSVMPSTLLLTGNKLVATMRRRRDTGEVGEELGRHQENWIDAYQSENGGRTWRFLSKVADTDDESHRQNGNPPSMVQLPDGRLAVTYGFRGANPGIRARISADEGRTWGAEMVLRDDALLPTIGYTRSVVRDDGKVVTVYYYNMPDGNVDERLIAATIWHPDEM